MWSFDSAWSRARGRTVIPLAASSSLSLQGTHGNQKYRPTPEIPTSLVWRVRQRPPWALFRYCPSAQSRTPTPSMVVVMPRLLAKPTARMIATLSPAASSPDERAIYLIEGEAAQVLRDE